jgi:hypothetical protein
MTDDTAVGRSELDRAMTLAEMAPHQSVTVGVLAGQEGGFPEARTHEPPVRSLEGTEAPAYVLTNEQRGIGLGTKRNTTTPADGRGSVCLVTDRRTLCLVGGDDEDEVIEVPHEAVASVEYHTSLLRKRFVLRTPRKQYHYWVPRSTATGLLEQAATYVRERTSEDPDELDDGVAANQLTYRGQPVSPENHPGVSTTPSEDGSTESEQSSDDGGVQYRGQPIDRSN